MPSPLISTMLQETIIIEDRSTFPAPKYHSTNINKKKNHDCWVYFHILCSISEIVKQDVGYQIIIIKCSSSYYLLKK